ncbi:MAG TPA: ComF family protein [Actinomycetota bacterium]
MLPAAAHHSRNDNIGNMQGVDVLQVLLGPPACEGCGARSGALCEVCREELGRPDTTAPIPGIDRALARWVYGGAARNLILALKLRGMRVAAVPLVAAMRAEVLAQGLLGDVVTWVPGRRRDTRRRGYDHAEALARGLARALGLDARPLLRRTTDPADQTQLGAAARRLNLSGAFEAERCPAEVVLVDDLVTTGSTATACALALRAGGATTVELVVPCRA